MKHENKRTEILVGAFLLFGMLLLAGLIVRFSSLREFFRDSDRYSLLFDDSSGLTMTAPVRLGGSRIGNVAKAPRLTPEGRSIIDISVYRDERFRIPRGSRIIIAKEGLLGDAYISIERPRDVSGGFYEPGETIEGSSTTGLDALQESAGKISVDVAELVKELREGTQKFNAAIARFDTQVLSQENTDSIKNSLTSLNQALTKLDEQVLSQENTANIKDTISSLRATSESLAKQAERIEPLLAKGDAAMAKFGQAADSFKETGSAFKSAAEKAGKTFGEASDGDGLLAAILNDPQLRDDFKSLIANLRSRGVIFYKDRPKEDESSGPSRRAPIVPPRPPGR